MSDPLFVYDFYGRRIYVGDYVECLVDYPSLEKGQRRRVQDIIAGCIKLRNDTEYGASVYRPARFKRVSQHNPAHRNAILFKQVEYVFHNQEKKPMFHIAIAIIEGQDWNELAHIVNTVRGAYMADTSADALKEKIRIRLSKYPDEKWLICSANTIGERAEPPVRFRSV